MSRHDDASRTTGADSPTDFARFWSLDPAATFLNHGSFGACPIPVLERQAELRAELERQPVRFLGQEIETRLDEAREALAAFVGADAEDLVFVDNATTGVNAVLRSLSFRPGDELIVTDHEYNATRNVVDFVASRDGARVVVAPVLFPLDSPAQVEAAVLARITPRTRLVVVDHVTSQTGLVLPVERLAPQLAERGIDLLVDGAHAPGMLPLDLRRLGAPFYTGNCHKWLCAPKGAAFLHVRRDRQASIRPPVISHGANSPRTDRSRFLLEFGWTGTDDPTAFLCVPEAIAFLGSLLPGGWAELRERNRTLALAARDLLCRALEIEPPAPDAMIGTLAAVPLPDGTDAPPGPPLYRDRLEEELESRHGIVVPIKAWPAPPQRVLRVSAQVYNSLPQYERLAEALAESPAER